MLRVFVYLGLLWGVAACSAGPRWAPDWARTAPGEIPVQVQQRDENTQVYISPTMRPRPGRPMTLARCYRNREAGTIRCQLFVQVHTLEPLGQRKISYRLGDRKVVGPLTLVTEDRACGMLCDQFNSCAHTCYNVYLLTHNLEPETVERLRGLAALPADLREPLEYTLEGEGRLYRGAIAPTALEALFLEMGRTEAARQESEAP